MDAEKSTARDEAGLSRLLGELRAAGRKPDRALLDRVKSYGRATVRPLIEMAVDERLRNADSENPEVWAPLHAIQLLGELGASEAVEPLLPLFDRVDDDAFAELLPEAFGSFGAPAVAPLRTLLFDRSRDVWARVRAAESLGKIGQRHAGVRSEVVNALVARLDPAESQTPKDEILVAFVISELVHLQATEAAPEIRRAFEEDRVDTSILDLDYALEGLGLSPEPRKVAPAERTGMRLRLRCTACQYEREHHVETVYCDLPTHERRQKGEKTPYREYVIPQRITCPKCGAVDRYELTGEAYLAFTVEMMKKLGAHAAGRPGAGAEEGPLKFIRFTVADGREMHPYAARDMYRQRVDENPNRADLRVRYANVLRFLDYREDAIEQYRAALRLEDSNLEALLNLARLAREAGDLGEASRRYESLLTHASSSRLSRDDRERYVEVALEELDELAEPFERGPLFGARSRLVQREDLAGRGAVQPAPALPPTRVTSKVGRNNPCPCGSGKKYKKCHGR